MASLEFIKFTLWRESDSATEPFWLIDGISQKLHFLPQIFWGDGQGWAEVNHWILWKLIDQGVTQETAKSLIKHLHAYANFLEDQDIDWRHFPVRSANRATDRFRGHLMNCIGEGQLAGSTAQSRLNAVIQFYRHARVQGFVSSHSPMWIDKPVTVRLFDSAGFARSLNVLSTNLAIPNRSRPGVQLEDGLLPLTEEHMIELLNFAAQYSTRELMLMLKIGFFTGARLGTITSLNIKCLEEAMPDHSMNGFYLVRVGPGTGIATKFNVQGSLLFPDLLLEELKQYAYSTERLKREALANKEHRSLLFLTLRGRRYTGNSISRLMTDVRRKALKMNLKFMSRFKFHQTRATYGTWMMKLVLSVTTPNTAIAFVRSAMLHKHESTTLKYIRFLEVTQAKEQTADAFNRAFTGLSQRDWNTFGA